MEFRTLDSSEQFDKIVQARGSNIIYKHNTTCPISKSVKRKLEEDFESLPKDTPVYILDLLSHHNVSDSIADTFNVPHQSSEILVIKDGKCIYSKALYEISAEETAHALHEENN